MQKGFYLFETDLGHYSQTQVGKISSLGDEKTGGYISKDDLGHYFPYAVLNKFNLTCRKGSISLRPTYVTTPKRRFGKISSSGNEKTGGYISKGDLGHYGDQRDISTRSYPKRKFTKSSDTRDLDYFRLVFVLLYLPMFQNQSYSLVGYM